VLAVSLVSTAEFVLELIEYPLLYANHFHHSAYYDTLADMANSLVGAVVGAVAAVPLTHMLARRHS
jgi:ABC-type phosphate/phosphonate transport system permease subunit